MKRQRKIRVAVVDHSACLFVQTFVNFIELSLSLSLSDQAHFPDRFALMDVAVAVAFGFGSN